MRRFCVLVFIAALASCAKAQIRVKGEISGLFLTQQGQLVWRTLSGDGSALDLQPLWGHYRLVLTVESHGAPVKSVEVTNGHGRKIWQQNFEPPRSKCRIPAYPPSALQIHTSDRFKFRLSIALADGSKLERQWKAPIDRPVHPFRIDWLSVAAATEALRLLRMHGKELFPQSSRISVAWCFRGENGQLFVNHPNPPKGSKRVNLPLLPGVLTFWFPEKQRPFFTPGKIKGTTVLIGGKRTCCIDYVPEWANRDPGASKVDIFNATIWVYIALHEALHAVSLSTFKVKDEQIVGSGFKFIPPDKWVDWLVTKWMEQESLRQAIDAAEKAKEVEETKEMREAQEKGVINLIPPPVSWAKSKEDWQKLSRQWSWAFLRFREKRRALYGVNRRWLTKSERVIEWTENISHWGAVRLLEKAEQEKMSPLLVADPTAANYPDDWFESWADDFSEVVPSKLELQFSASYGLGKLLSLWDENWIQKTAKGEMLEDLLAEITGYITASEEERNAAIDEVVSEILPSAIRIRQELQHFFAPAEGKPCLIVRGEEPKSLDLEWREDVANGQLDAIVFKWEDSSSLVVGRGGKVAFQGGNQVAVYAPVNEPLRFARYSNQFSVQIGEFVSFKWLPESGALSVQVLDKRWSFKNGRSKPKWLPPEGWVAVQVGQNWLWLKASVRGGFQFLTEGGKRWEETPMVFLHLKSTVFSLNRALAVEAPSELVFTARPVDKNLKIRSLSLRVRSLVATDLLPTFEGEGEFTAQTRSPKGERELRLALPFKLSWRIERSESDRGRLAWFARFGDKEIRWFLGAVLAEVKVELTNGKAVEIPFVSGVSHPWILAVEVKTHQETPGDITERTFIPAVGARCRIFLHRGKFDLNKAQCIAEGVVGEAGNALLLIHAFNPEKIGLSTSVFVEHESMGCRRLEGLYLSAFEDHALFGSTVPVNSFLAPHEVTLTIEIEGVRQLIKFERRDKEWEMIKEREEPITKVRVIVKRVESFVGGESSRIVFDGEVDGRLTLTVPTFEHELGDYKEPQGYLQIRMIDPVTGGEKQLNFSIGVHGLYYHEGEKVLQLVGKDNPPIKVKLTVTQTVTVTSSNPTK